MNGIGGRVRLCEDCGRRTCISPHTLCSSCRDQVVTPKRQRTRHAMDRANARKRRRRQMAGLPEIYEGSEG